MEIEEEPVAKGRLKPSRPCVLTVAAALGVGGLLYLLCHRPRPPPPPPLAPTRAQGHVSILLDERSPYNVTVTSDLDVIHSLDSGGTRVQINVRDLLDNKTAGPVRITRSNGDEYDVRLSFDLRPPPPAPHRLTPLEEIRPSVYNVFFIETRCGTAKALEAHSPNAGVVLSARQVCAVESTARLNPSRPVYLLHSCPLDARWWHVSPEYVRQLAALPNVHVVHLDMAEFFLRTSVEELFFGGRFEESAHPVEHASDVLRLLTLWRYGGTYMDIDVVSIRPLDELGSNFAGWQDERTVASGVLNFQPEGLGHRILSECLDDLKFNFEPHAWSTNGPILVTNTLMRICGIGSPSTSSKCREFTVYPESVFYPIYYSEWRLFFDTRAARRALNRLNDTFVVHIWGKMSSQGVVTVGSGQAYGILADQYCPGAYRHCGPTF